MHWRKKGGAGSKRFRAINAIGAIATGITTLVVVVAKFAEGALDHAGPCSSHNYDDALHSPPLPRGSA